MPRKNPPKMISVYVQAKLANDFQEECFRGAFTAAIEAIVSFQRSSHKKNEITYTINWPEKPVGV